MKPVAQTFGQYWINSTLPKGYAFSGAVTNKELQNTLARVAKDDPKGFVKIVTDLKRAGDEVASVEGISVGLDDIAPHYASRDPVIKSALKQIQGMTDHTQRRDLIHATQKKIEAVAATHPGDMALMARSGSRGRMNQFMKTVAGVSAAAKPGGDTVPWLITKGYSEGLSPAEYWIAGDEAREGVVSGKIQVTEPGEVGKLLTQTMMDQVVVDPDCGTHNGIPVLASDIGDLQDRYLAQAAGHYPRNTLVTQAIARDLAKHLGDKPVMVRSPMTCQHLSGGVCAKCVGLDEKGQAHSIGVNVGVRSATAMTEPLTQMVLSAKHGARLAGGAAHSQRGIDAVKSLLQIPKVFPYAATLSQLDGKVTRITPAPQGGHYVFVEHTEHYVPPDLDIKVHVQQKLEAGDPISSGVGRPDEIVRYKGLGVGRKHLVDQLSNVYKDAGMGVDKRHLEILARSQLNHVQIDDDPRDEFTNSEIVPLQLVRMRLEEDALELPVDKADGKRLAHDYTYFSAGTRVTPAVISALKSHGVHTVKIAPDDAPKFTPHMASLERTPLLRPDWLARMGHRYLKQSLEEGAQYAQGSDLHSLHPLPAYVYGVEMGTGEGGKY